MLKSYKEPLKTFLCLILAFSIPFLITNFICIRTVVSGSSMSPTYENGDNLITNKITYCFNDPKRFDVIIFPVENEGYYIKRIIGLPGETIKINFNGDIYINGEVLKESYGKEKIRHDRIGRAWTDITLGEDEYFVMGDNRNNSNDSRNSLIGNIKKSDIIGKAWFSF